jgi:hypothetical protein
MASADPVTAQGTATQQVPYSQYSFRAQKDLGIVYGAPSYEPSAFQK